jgi:hypothetical protein
MRLAAKNAQGVLGEFFSPMRFARRGSGERGEIRKTRRLRDSAVDSLWRYGRIRVVAQTIVFCRAVLASRQATKNDGLPHPRYNRLLHFETYIGGFLPLARIA